MGVGEMGMEMMGWRDDGWDIGHFNSLVSDAAS